MTQENHSKPNSTQGALLKAAKQVFAEKGFEGATVKEISDRAGVNISLVSYHFNGKENLLKACLDQMGSDGLEITSRTLKPAENLEEFKVRFRLFIDAFFDQALKEPELHAIILRDCSSMHHPLILDAFANLFSKIFEIVVKFFAQAQKNKILSHDFIPRIAAQQVIAILSHTIRMDSVHFKFYGESIEQAAYREKITEHLMNLILKGLRL